MSSNVRVGVAALACLVAGTALAEIRGGDTVTIGADEVVGEDLYVAGGTIRIDGAVEGDVIAAGGTLEINGVVTGDVMAAVGTLKLNGPVSGSVRAAGGEVEASSQIAEDLVFGGGTLTVAENGSVGRDLMGASGMVRLYGPVERNVEAAGGEVLLSSAVGGHARLTSDQVRLTDGATVDGKLTYSSRNPIERAPGAQVGSIEQVAADQPQAAPVTMFFYRWFRAIVAFAILGLVLGLLFPRFSRTVPETLRTSPWRSLGFGAALFLVVPVVAVLVTVLGALIGGWWLGLLVLAAFLTAWALSFPAVGYFIGNLATQKLKLSRSRQVMALILGVALVTLAIRIPLLGLAIGLAVVLFGLGALLLSGLQLRRQATAAVV